MKASACKGAWKCLKLLWRLSALFPYPSNQQGCWSDRGVQCRWFLMSLTSGCDSSRSHGSHGDRAVLNASSNSACRRCNCRTSWGRATYDIGFATDNPKRPVQKRSKDPVKQRRVFEKMWLMWLKIWRLIESHIEYISTQVWIFAATI